jgi:hypothetical protein
LVGRRGRRQREVRRDVGALTGRGTGPMRAGPAGRPHARRESRRSRRSSRPGRSARRRRRPGSTGSPRGRSGRYLPRGGRGRGRDAGRRGRGATRARCVGRGRSRDHAVAGALGVGADVNQPQPARHLGVRPLWSQPPQRAARLGEQPADGDRRARSARAAVHGDAARSRSYGAPATPSKADGDEAPGEGWAAPMRSQSARQARGSRTGTPRWEWKRGQRRGVAHP